MNSNKQRRAQIKARRASKATRVAASRDLDPRLPDLPNAETAPCNPALLAAYNSYGFPPFVARGYYVDSLFACAQCQKQEVWRATQQKWWYEVAKGNVESRAKLCNACRRAERKRRSEARRVHMEGVQGSSPPKVRPNPSLERRPPTAWRLGRGTAKAYHRSRGPSATPPGSPQLER